MSNSKLYQPPPPPPKPREAAKDPLLALSRAPTVLSPVAAPAPAEELMDLTDDASMEEWSAKGGTRIMAKPQREPTPVPTMVAGPVPMPSYHPVAMSAPPAPAKKSSAALWFAVVGVLVLGIGAAAAVAGLFIYRAHEESATVTATTAPTATVADPPAVTVAPTVTATATVTPTATVTATATATASTTATATLTSTSTKRASSTSASGSIRTFAAGNGKPVYVDGKQVGVGGSKIATACGHHMVAVGTGRARSVYIPCSGSTITVGTPDGE